MLGQVDGAAQLFETYVLTQGATLAVGFQPRAQTRPAVEEQSC
jgi:hypothetical protein